MAPRRDPRAEIDEGDPSEVAEHYVDYGVRDPDPESARRIQPAGRSISSPYVAPLHAPEGGRGVVEANDLADLPPDSPMADSPRARRVGSASQSAPESGIARAPDKTPDKASVRPPPAEKGSVRPPPQISYRQPIDGAPPVSRRSADSAVVTSLDPRLEQIDPHVDEGNWNTVARQLGSLEESGQLPPTLGLVAAVAHSETAGDAGSPEASDLGIRCVAGLFGVSPESAIARVLAKRVLRRSPRPSQVGSTMPAALALVLIAAFLITGLIGGYLIGSGIVKLPSRLRF